MPYLESQQTPDVLRQAISQGQQLAGVLPVNDLLHRLVEVVHQVCDARYVWVYLVNAAGGYTLRAMLTPDGDIQIVEEKEPETDEDGHQPRAQVPTRDDAVLNAPMNYKGTALGMLQVLPSSQDATSDVRLALELLASFAACGVINVTSTAVMREQVEKQGTLGKVITRTRLTAMNELAAAVSHQLNNPLTTIVADAEILLMQTEPGSEMHQSLDAIVRSGRRAAEVVRRLMAVARPNKLVGVPQPVNVPQTIDEVLHLIRRYIEVENITIERKYAENIPLIWVAPDALGDVWLNLLTNARDALAGVDDAQIGIEVNYEKGADEIQVCIWDNGRGMTKQEMDVVFEPFFTTKPPVERMGLGLHISKQVVEGLGGEITVFGRDEGGTYFEVCLPVRKGD